MAWIKKLALLAMGSCIAACGTAGTPAQSYSLGKLRIVESSDLLVISAIDGSKARVRIEAGGGLWPPLVIEDTGRVNAGSVQLDAKSGRVLTKDGAVAKDVLQLGHGVTAQLRKESIQLQREGKRCTIAVSKFGLSNPMPPADLIRARDLLLATSDSDTLALTRNTVEGPEGRRREYAVKKVDMARCSVKLLQDLGDPDYLVEMDWSKDGGWWITGSKEQTILRSADGSKWTQVPVNEDIASLFSTHIVNANEIWVAAMMVAPPGSEQFDLAYSPDNGANWIGVRPSDPAMAKIPAFWLEGVRRAAAAK